MDTITCPRCGTENAANAMNCSQCRINLKFALENPEVERIEQEAAERERLDESQEPHVTVSRKEARKKKGSIYLLVAVVCLAISLLLYESQNAASTQEAGLCTGAIGAIAALGMVICLVIGVIYLILGFVGRE